ncbi:related to POP5 - subunit of both RNase MRP and nuclear RNase P [Ustilago sp. UG-2017b]|nr:related to POP5 - subunit of both RNase MRP and nuclear RNase P [Ustilago sp. UG-2017b]
MVRFKTRWLLLAIDGKPLATTSPFASTLDESSQESASAKTLSAAQQTRAEANAASALTPQLITRLLRASLLYNFGDVAAGAFGGVLTCKYYSTHTGTAILRCSRDAARLVWASATLISSPVEMVVGEGAGSSGSLKLPSLRIRVIHCGGTIKKVQNKAIELDSKLITRLRAKQRKLAATDTNPKGSKASIAPIVEKEITAVPVVSLAAIDDEEDLGEALGADSTLAADVPMPVPDAEAKGAKASRKAVTSSDLDPETQALLAQSRKQINSITI